MHVLTAARGLATGALCLALGATAHATVFLNNQAAYNAAAPSAALVENFEATGQPSNAVLGPSFSHNGVNYTSLVGVPGPNFVIAIPGYNNFGAGVGTLTTNVLAVNGDEAFQVSFDTPVSAFGFDAYFNGLGPTTLNIYSGATLLDTLTTASGLDFIGHLGVTSVGSITSFTWITTNGGQLNTGIDNLTTQDTQGVPEPASLALLGLALAAAARVSRKRLGG